MRIPAIISVLFVASIAHAGSLPSAVDSSSVRIVSSNDAGPVLIEVTPSSRPPQSVHPFVGTSMEPLLDGDHEGAFGVSHTEYVTTDVADVQWAVSNVVSGGTVVLKHIDGRPFEFGNSAVFVPGVNLTGEVDAAGKPLTVIEGGSVPVRANFDDAAASISIRNLAFVGHAGHGIAVYDSSGRRIEISNNLFSQGLAYTFPDGQFTQALAVAWCSFNEIVITGNVYDPAPADESVPDFYLEVFKSQYQSLIISDNRGQTRDTAIALEFLSPLDRGQVSSILIERNDMSGNRVTAGGTGLSLLEAESDSIKIDNNKFNLKAAAWVALLSVVTPTGQLLFSKNTLTANGPIWGMLALGIFPLGKYPNITVNGARFLDNTFAGTITAEGSIPKSGYAIAAMDDVFGLAPGAFQNLASDNIFVGNDFRGLQVPGGCYGYLDAHTSNNLFVNNPGLGAICGYPQNNRIMPK